MNCQCDCPECKAGNCAACSNESCASAGCDCGNGAMQADAAGHGGFLVSGSGGDHLPTMMHGRVDHGLMGAAWAALHEGSRGNKYEGPDKEKAIAKLTALYHSEKMPLPGESAPAAMHASFDAVELLQADGSLSEPTADGWVWPAVMIRAGFSAISIPGLPEKFRNLPVYVTPEFIAKAPAHFDGSPAYLGHQVSSEGRVRALFGGWKNVRAEGPELKGDLHILKAEGVMRDKLAEAHSAGLPIGLSFNALAGYKAEKREGRDVMALTEPLPLPNIPRSVDVVMYPAAQGHFLPVAAEGELAAAVEAARKQFLKPPSGLPEEIPSSA